MKIRKILDGLLGITIFAFIFSVLMKGRLEHREFFLAGCIFFFSGFSYLEAYLRERNRWWLLFAILFFTSAFLFFCVK